MGLPLNPLIPLWMKIVYTIFVVALVPIYWRIYGPANFFFFCDVALLLTVPALWLENRLLVSMMALLTLIPQSVWLIDFFSILICGRGPLGLTTYMFKQSIPLYVRGLSLFHGWLPIFHIYLVAKLRYDPRALTYQTILGTVIFLICYFLLPSPPAKPGAGWSVNINYAYGLSDKQPQTWMPPLLWLAILIVGFPIVAYLPAHFLLQWLFRRTI